MKYVGHAVCRVARLDELPEENFILKHILEQVVEQQMKLSAPERFRKLSFRIFCAQPGVYRSGVNLTVYALV